MPVVINEFEVVAEPPPSSPAQAQPGGDIPLPKPMLAAQEVERLLRHEEERALRVWAH
jgi:hypothetical protein